MRTLQGSLERWLLWPLKASLKSKPEHSHNFGISPIIQRLTSEGRSQAWRTLEHLWKLPNNHSEPRETTGLPNRALVDESLHLPFVLMPEATLLICPWRQSLAQ